MQTKTKRYKDQAAFIRDKPNWVGWHSESNYVPAKNPGCFAAWMTLGIALLFRKPAYVEATYYREDA